MTSTEVSKRTGVPRATIAKWVADGLLRPRGGQSFGRGDALYFDETDVRRVQAIAAIRRAFGDGEKAREAISKTLPLLTADTATVRISEFALALE